MHYAPRTIAYLCELRHPPLNASPASIQKVHNRMFESGSPAYKSFNVTPDGAILSNPPGQPGAISQVSFHPDRVQFREELTGLSVDEFARRVEEILAQVAPDRGIRVLTAQTVTLRTLVNPQHFQDSRDFLRQGMFGFGDELSAFGRPSRLFGLRLVFPPTPEETNAFTLRVESFANDPRSLFLENQGSFGPAQGFGLCSANVQATYAYLVEKALPFLANFDLRQEA